SVSVIPAELIGNVIRQQRVKLLSMETKTQRNLTIIPRWIYRHDFVSLWVHGELSRCLKGHSPIIEDNPAITILRRGQTEPSKESTDGDEDAHAASMVHAQQCEPLEPVQISRSGCARAQGKCWAPLL